MRISWAAASDTGLRRSSNEDSYCARPEIGLFVVADGMGGHVAGEVASRIAVETIETFIGETVATGENDTWPFPFEPTLGINGNRLKAAFRIANRRIAARMQAVQGLKGMATTASALLITDSVGAVAHVGDSRMYLLRRGHLDRLTRDHSWVEEQVRAGALTASAARQHPWRNVVTRALAGGDDPEVDVSEVPFEPGDRVLLCSDGLYSVAADERIGELLGLDGALADVCARLVDAANSGGGPDNVTALVVQLDGP